MRHTPASSMSRSSTLHMMMRVTVILVALLSVLVQNTDASAKKTRKRVVCYYTNWSVYRLGLAKFLPNNINPHLCTHLVYAFGGFSDDYELQPFDKYQDIDKGGYARFNGLKQYNRGLRTLLALGGWNEGSARFSELVAEPEYRKRFVFSAVRYLRQYNFDGLDLDWEYPGSRGGSDPDDKPNYVTLCQELRAAFHEESVRSNRPELLLTVAVPAGVATIDKGFDVAALNAQVDFFNILAYDYHASSEPLTDHHAPLLAPPGGSEFDYRTELNVDYTVKYYVSQGAERRKLVVGIPTYGRSYTLLDAGFSGVQAAAESPGVKGKHTKEDGYLSFYEICELVAVDGWQVYRPYPDQMGPYATKDKQWVGYDDEFAVRKKAEYVRDNQLGGIMFWSVDNDDFRGRCSGKPYPLIEAAKQAYLSPVPGSPPKQEKGPTPPPPPTPDPDADFQCKREGFYPHPQKCNSYFWCLGGGPLGIVPHSFTCPTGLLFNRNTDACDFPRSVKCKITEKQTESITFPPTKKPITTDSPASLGSTENPFDDYYEDYDETDLSDLSLDVNRFPGATLTETARWPPKPPLSDYVLGGSRGGQTPAPTPDDDEESDPTELKQLLALITNLGGVQGVEKLLAAGDSSASQISAKDRKTLEKIVGRQQTKATSGAVSNINNISVGNRPKPNSRQSVDLAARYRQPAQPIGNTRSVSNTRRQPVSRFGADQTPTATVNRRRPQYTSIQRDRSAPQSRAEPVSEAPAVRQYSNIARAAASSASSPASRNPLADKQYVTLERAPSAAPQLNSALLTYNSALSVDNDQVVARRYDSPDPPGFGLVPLPALAALPLLSPAGRYTALVDGQLAGVHSAPVAIFDTAVATRRVARRRTLLQNTEPAPVDRSGRPSANTVQDSRLADDSVSANIRSRGSKRFSLRRNYRRRIAASTTQQYRTPTEYTTEPTETVSVEESTPASTTTVSPIVTLPPQPERVRGPGRLFNFAGRRSSWRSRVRTDETEEVTEDFLETTPDPDSEEEKSQVVKQQIPGSDKHNGLKSENTVHIPVFHPSPVSRLIARKVPQRKVDDISSRTENEPLTPKSTTFTLRRSSIGERPDPLKLTRSLQKSSTDKSSDDFASLSTTPLSLSSSTSESPVEEIETSSLRNTETTSDITTELTPKSAPFSRKLSNSRVRPFPFRPRSNKRISSLSKNLPGHIDNHDDDDDDDDDVDEDLEGSSTNVVAQTTTELQPTVPEEMTSTHDTTSTTSTTQKPFHFSTLSSRRSSTVRPPFRTRPTSSVSLYDLVSNRDDDSKRLHVQSLVEKLKSSLSEQQANVVEDKVNVTVDNVEQQEPNQSSRFDVSQNSLLSVSASVSNVEHHSTVSVAPVVLEVNYTDASSTHKASTSPSISLNTLPASTTEAVAYYFTPSITTTLSPVYSPTASMSTTSDRASSHATASHTSSDNWSSPAAVGSSREARLLTLPTSTSTTTSTTVTTTTTSSSSSSGSSTTVHWTTASPYSTASDGVVIVTAATLPPPPPLPSASDSKSFVSVKVSVSSSSSDSQSIETHHHQQQQQQRPSAASATVAATTQSPVDALFSLLSQRQQQQEGDQSGDSSGRAERLDGPLLQASMVNRRPSVVQSTSNSAHTPLYDSLSILAFSTVTPRYQDPDSLFKRMTYLDSGSAPLLSHAVLTVSVLTTLLARYL